MRFDASNPDRLTPVTWFFAPTGRGPIGVNCSFSSLNWVDRSAREVDDGVSIGEVGGQPRPYSHGAAPSGTPPSGSYCGTPTQWEDGFTFLGGPTPRPFQWADCCPPGPVGPCVTSSDYPDPCVLIPAEGPSEPLGYAGGQWPATTFYNVVMVWKCISMPPYGLGMGMLVTTLSGTPSYYLTPVGYDPLTRIYSYRDDVGTVPHSPLGSFAYVQP